MEPTDKDIAQFRRHVLAEVNTSKGRFNNRDVERLHVSNNWLRRFLIDNDLNQEKATKQVLKTLKWRQENGVNDLSLADVNLTILNHGGMFSCSRDKDGRKLFILRPATTVKGTFRHEDIRKCLLYWFERLEREEDYSGVTMFADMAGAKLCHVDLETAYFIMESLVEYYPYFCQRVLIFELPRFFSSIWNMIRLLVPAKKLKRVVDVDRATLNDFVEPDQQLVEWGGSFRYEFRFTP